jgi:hypothetical protein
MLSADPSIAVVIAINVILRNSWKLLYRLRYRLLYRLLYRCSSWNIRWSFRGLSSWSRRYVNLVVIIALLRGTTCELGGSTSDISSKKGVNISSFFPTTDSVENNLGLSSLNSFLSILKITSRFRFIFYSYIRYRKSLAFQGLSLNHSISKTIVLEPKNKNFNNIIELELPSIVGFISSVLTIENIEDIISRRIIFLK